MYPNQAADPFLQLVHGLAAASHPRQQPAPPPLRRDTVEVSARDLLSAIREAGRLQQERVGGADTGRDFPWGLLLAVGILGGLGLGIGIALLATRRR